MLAHPLSDGTCAVLSHAVDATAASLDAFHSGDGAAWRRLHTVWERLGPDILSALFPPSRPCSPVPGRPCGCVPRAGCGRPAR